MIDGDDRDDQSPEGRDSEGEASSAAPAADAARTDDERRTDADEPADAGETTAEEPAMTLEAGSEEGGTIEQGDDTSAEAEPSDQGAECGSVEEPAEEPEAFVEPENESGFEGEDLGLVSDDDALPWLESSDYEEIESVDAWRITGFVVLGLVVLALIVGGIWYFGNRGESGTPVADGSVIEAPDEPYKERPEDPGGKTFEGTGDMAPAVGEGETREGRLAEGSATPEPVAPEQTPADEQPEETPAAPAATDNRIVVQVGAYRDKATAEEGWRKLQRQTDALSGVQYRVVKGEADIGTVYRLQAVPGDMAAARRLRDALEADGVASQIKQ